MARVLVAPQTPPGAFPSLPVTPGSRALSEQAADPALGNYTPIVSGKTLILAHNTDSGAHTVTFTSVVDGQNRSGDITAYSIAAGAIALFGPFVTVPTGWAQSTPAASSLWMDANDATIKWIVLTQA